MSVGRSVPASSKVPTSVPPCASSDSIQIWSTDQSNLPAATAAPQCAHTNGSPSFACHGAPHSGHGQVCARTGGLVCTLIAAHERPVLDDDARVIRVEDVVRLDAHAEPQIRLATLRALERERADHDVRDGGRARREVRAGERREVGRERGEASGIGARELRRGVELAGEVLEHGDREHRIDLRDLLERHLERVDQRRLLEQPLRAIEVVLVAVAIDPHDHEDRDDDARAQDAAAAGR